jgi:succinoglycan biosynthesis transport protein ExoP
VNVKNHEMKIENKTFTLQDYMEIFWRRKWWFTLPIILGIAISIVYSHSVTPLYRSSTLILVEPQRVPESYISPTVTSSVENRLNTISQQILSRTNLEKIIREFGLYKPHETAPSGFHRLADSIQAKVLMVMGVPREERSTVWNPAEYVDGMKTAIEITVMGTRTKKNAFTVAYSGKDPQTVMGVTNALASLFIEESLRVSERQAEGTSEFLASELSAAERELQDLEKSLKEFKERHNGSLPEQLDSNHRTLDRLQSELQNINISLKNAEDKKFFYEQQQLESSKYAPIESNTNKISKTQQNPLESELSGLKKELANLQAQFKENYPDIITTKERIREIESQISDMNVHSDKGSFEKENIEKKKESVQIPIQYNINLQNINSEINSLKERKKRISDIIRDTENKVEQTYTNELNLISLTRNYQISKKKYEELLSKKLNATMAENLEKKQMGAQFRILDPANMPIIPFKPDRTKIIFIGSMISGCIGVAIIFLLEYTNSSLRKPEDIYDVIDIPVFVSIPHEKNYKNKKRIIAVDESESIITEQYRILYTKINDLRESEGKKVFAISSSIQGEGRTTSSLNLAVVAARDFGRKTLLLEGDFKTPSISSYLKNELESGLVDILLNKTNVQSTLIPFADTLIPFADDNLSVLPAVKRVRNSSGLLSSRKMRDLLEILKYQYDLILIDAPPVLPLSDMNIFEEVVDGIIMVVRAEKTPKNALVKAMNVLEKDKIIGIVLNDVHKNLSRYVYKYKYVSV